jgi:hypothetical protein
MRHRFAMLVVAVLTAACSDQATAPRAHAPALAADFMNNPDVGNGVIYRYGSDWAICWTDPSNHLRACHRTQQFPSGDCGVFEPIGGIGAQDVVTVNDPFDSEIKTNSMGRLWITVRDLSQPGACYGALRVAEGWGSFHYTDNDLWGVDPNGAQNTNAVGFRADGILTASDGSPVVYSGHREIQWSNDGVLRVLSSVVRAE